MNAQDAKILGLLSDGREWYGLDLVTASDGVLQRGTIYVRLGWLEDQGLVTSREEAPEVIDARIGIARRLYRITHSGRRKLAEGEAGGAEPVPA